MQDYSIIKDKAFAEIEKAESSQNLIDLRVKYLGKTGEITSLMKNMKDIAPEERANFGKVVNELKNEVEKAILAKDAKIKEIELERKIKDETLDITLPGKDIEMGNLHPLNIVKNQIIDAFTGMGFTSLKSASTRGIKSSCICAAV